MHSTRFLVVTLILLCSTAAAHDNEAADAADIESAQQEYEQAIRDAAKEYVRTVQQARTKYIETLDTAMREATRAGDLDRA